MLKHNHGDNSDSNHISSSTSTNSVVNSFFLESIDVNEIKRYINNMDQSKSARSDTPRIKLIKLSVNIIAPYVTKIFNLCILKGVFPESLKFAEVIPIFKSGSKAEVNNYRPISLLSPFAKIFESYIYSQLISFINKHNILPT